MSGGGSSRLDNAHLARGSLCAGNAPVQVRPVTTTGSCTLPRSPHSLPQSPEKSAHDAAPWWSWVGAWGNPECSLLGQTSPSFRFSEEDEATIETASSARQAMIKPKCLPKVRLDGGNKIGRKPVQLHCRDPKVGWGFEPGGNLIQRSRR